MTRTALVLSVAGVLLTGSAALAVNTQTLKNSSSSTTGNANEVLLPQNATTPSSPVPTETSAPSPSQDRSAVPSPTPSAQPTSSRDANDDHSGRGKNETEHSGNDD